MRYRVDFEFGFASFDASEQDRAIRLYLESGDRLRLCDDIFDEGRVIMGPPIIEEIDLPKAARGQN